MGKCSFGQLTDFGLANLKLFNRTNTIIKVSFYLSLQNTDVRIRLANVVTVHNEGVYNWVNSALILFWYKLLPSTSRPQKFQKSGFYKSIISVFPCIQSMNNETLVVFLCKNWFVYQTTQFKAHFWRDIFLKIDINFWFYQ